MATCTATKNNGKPCTFGARPSGLCHVHDPAVQCGGRKKNGDTCRVTTGGGRCPVHADQTVSDDQGALFMTDDELRADAVARIARGMHLPAEILGDFTEPRLPYPPPMTPAEMYAEATRQLDGILLDHGIVPVPESR